MSHSSGLINIAVFVLCLSKSFSAPTKTDNTQDNSSKQNPDHPRIAVSDNFMSPADFYTVTSQRSQEQEYQPVSPFNAYHHTSVAQAQTDFYRPNTQNYYGSLFPETFSFDQLRPSLGANFPYIQGIPSYAAPLPKVNSKPLPQSPLENHHTSLDPNFPYSPEILSYPRPLPKVNSYPPPEKLNTELLGSGNFGVIRGGTFYPDDELPLHSEDGSDTSDYFGDASNSHNESNVAKIDFIDKYTYPEEQFEHFRDFAELSSPIDGAFSHFSSIHSISKASIQKENFYPKNIFEQLEEIDREKSLEKKKKSQTRSKSKSKLARTKLQKKLKTKLLSKDADSDPLVALS